MDVPLLRSLLMEIGTQQYNLIRDERRILTANKLVWTLFPQVVDVIGVYHVADTAKATNLAPSGAHDENTITVEGSANAGDELVCDYVVSEGLNDSTAQTVIDWAKYEVVGELNDSSYDIVNGTSDIERLGKVYWHLMAMFNAYLMLNNVNFVQSDANMALFNFQTMSKLWGEGMSTDALFGRLHMKIKDVQRTLHLMTTDSDVYTDVAGTPYWRDDNMFKDWLAQDLDVKPAQFTVTIQ
jgi:hypothetical protein